jgi:hypothetical protein
MNDRRILILLFVFLCSCNFRHSEKEKVVNSQTENTARIKQHFSKTANYISDDSLVAFKIDGVRRLSYKFNVDSSGYLLKSIIIYSDNIPIQIIEANKQIERKDFQLVDWNFDGYNDISVLSNCGSGGCAYWIWNYSKENGKYYYNNDLSEYLGLEIDTISKFIIFHYRFGYDKEWWDTLQYINNKLSFVKGLYRERGTDTTGNNWVKNIHTKMKDNKPITKVDSSITR